MISPPKIAVIGAGGFVGQALSEAFARNPRFQLFRVTRDNYETMKQTHYDYLINAAMPSKRFWAEKNPALDYDETVQKTKRLLREWHYKKFIHISSVSARMQQNTVYGKHKAEAEKLCGPTALIVRLTAMYGENLSKGALIDILNRRKVFISGESRYSFTPIEFVGEWLIKNLDRTGTVEVGARNSISLQEIASALGETAEFEGPTDIQEIQNPEPGFPDARSVIDFMTKKKKELHAES